MSVRVSFGLPDELRPAAAALYWEAFGGKLGRLMGPDRLALAFLETAIRSDHVFVAQDQDGKLMGLAGFKSPKGSFAGGTMADLRKAYGLIGSFWRAIILSSLERDVENERFLLDGICVARSVRSRGIGTALMQAVFVEAVARHYKSIRLDVIESNWRARALYERLGFMAVRTEKLGLLRHVFGFTSSITMVRPLDPDETPDA